MGNLKLSPRNWQRIRFRRLRAKPFPGTPTKFQPIEPIIFTVDIPLCVLLMSNPVAKYNWWLAGWVKTYLYSGAFVSRQIIGIQESRKVGLDRAELLNFRHYKTTNKKYAIEVNTARWHRQMNFTIWKYKGEVADAVDEYQQEIKLAVDELKRLIQNSNNS